MLQIPIPQLARRGDVRGISLDLLTLLPLGLRLLDDRSDPLFATTRRAPAPTPAVDPTCATQDNASPRHDNLRGRSG